MLRKRAETKVKQFPGGYGAPRFNLSPIHPPLTGLYSRLRQSIIQGGGACRILRIDLVDKVNRLFMETALIEKISQTHLFLLIGISSRDLNGNIAPVSNKLP
jgi:hypothetical protein